jgi:hypothetical protein
MKKKILFISCLAFLINYLSLFIPRTATVTRLDVMECEKSCDVIAGGFPLPYVIDGNTSPIGSISKNPLIIIFTNVDSFILTNFFINYLFWLIVIVLFFRKTKENINEKTTKDITID